MERHTWLQGVNGPEANAASAGNEHYLLTVRSEPRITDASLDIYAEELLT